jgi:hypothetical protein
MVTAEVEEALPGWAWSFDPAVGWAVVTAPLGQLLHRLGLQATADWGPRHATTRDECRGISRQKPHGPSRHRHPDSTCRRDHQQSYAAAT